MKNLFKEAEKFCAKLNLVGFNEVRIRAYREGSNDPAEYDGEPQKIRDEINKHYVCIVIEPEFRADMFYGDEPDNPYVYSATSIDYKGFWRDMKEEMQRIFGKDVIVSEAGFHGKQWEIYRQKERDEAYKKFDAWELEQCLK
jgi:hypothetical protein